MTRNEHLLAIVAEECDEVSQRALKALRFTVSEVQPGQPLDNAQRLVDELNDLIGAVHKLADAGIIPDNWLSYAKVKAKGEKIERFLELSRSLGALTDG